VLLHAIGERGLNGRVVGPRPPGPGPRPRDRLLNPVKLPHNSPVQKMA